MTGALDKAPSGIAGLDEITLGGLPRGRPTLVCGSAGCGKTMMGLQFLVRGAVDHAEPGAFVAFEEAAEDVAENVKSVGWDLEELERRRLLTRDHIDLEPALIQETGAFDLDALFIRLEALIDEIGARRIVLDTVEVLFAALRDQGIVRLELRRLFRWLKDKEVTAVITAERGEGALTRHGLEEYVSDCVILLDHRVTSQVSTRRLRIVKYRGSAHGTDETPFMIDRQGFRVMPLTSLRLEHPASDERVSSGIGRLDEMLAGEGYHRGASVLVTGTPGSGKTTVAASFARAGCERGERAMLFALEESPLQLQRNLASVGIELAPYVEAGALRISATRPSARGFEEHLAAIYHEVSEFDPQIVVIDPLSAFGTAADDLLAMLTRVIDLLKSRGTTALFTALTTADDDVSGLGISSVIDTWLELGTVEYNGERNRSLRVIKARGTSHSNQVREFLITSGGVELLDAYVGQGRVFMGTARRAMENEDRATELARRRETEAKRKRAERKRAEMEARIAAMRAELEELELEARAESEAEGRREQDRAGMMRARGGTS